MGSRAHDGKTGLVAYTHGNEHVNRKEDAFRLHRGTVAPALRLACVCRTLGLGIHPLGLFTCRLYDQGLRTKKGVVHDDDSKSFFLVQFFAPPELQACNVEFVQRPPLTI